MHSKRPQGRYRTLPTASRPPMAYVVDGGTASFIAEETYRSKRFEPDFDTLPTEQEYDA